MKCPKCGFVCVPGARYCDNCSHMFVWPEHPKGEQVPFTSRASFAGFPRRFGAFFIDLVLISAAMALFDSVIGSVEEPGGGLGGLNKFFSWGTFEFTFIFTVKLYFGPINLAYGALMDGSPLKATVGKLLLAIEVVDLNGERCSYMRAANRNLGKILTIFTIGIGYLAILFTDKKQSLHDILSGCVVTH